jgi:hypothetical protein
MTQNPGADVSFIGAVTKIAVPGLRKPVTAAKVLRIASCPCAFVVLSKPVIRLQKIINRSKKSATRLILITPILAPRLFMTFVPWRD